MSAHADVVVTVPPAAPTVDPAMSPHHGATDGGGAAAGMARSGRHRRHAVVDVARSSVAGAATVAAVATFATIMSAPVSAQPLWSKVFSNYTFAPRSSFALGRNATHIAMIGGRLGPDALATTAVYFRLGESRSATARRVRESTARRRQSCRASAAPTLPPQTTATSTRRRQLPSREYPAVSTACAVGRGDALASARYPSR